MAHTGWRLAALALAWLSGVALQLQQSDLGRPRVVVAAVAVTALVACLCAWRWPRRAVWLGFLAAALLGFGATEWRASHRLAESLPYELEGVDVQITGTVATLPQRSETGLRFRFLAERALRDGQAVAVPSQLALGWYAGWHADAVLSAPQMELRAGQRWAFTVRLRQPHGNLNPGGFDYELLLFEQGVRATGYVRDAATAKLLSEAAAHPVERLRQRVRSAIEAYVPDRRSAGVLTALVVGDQSAIERSDWDLYRNTGIAHLVSISGLHITMLAWLASAGVAVLWRRSTRLMLWCPAPRAAQWLGCGVAVAYAVFSGWGVPSQRTVWMLLTVALLTTLGVRWPWVLVLLWAAVVVTVLDPWALLQAGFWLSFVAVGLLMASQFATSSGTEFSEARVRGLGSRLWVLGGSALRSQVVATFGLTPLTLVFFQQVSVVGFAANLVAIPLVTLVITPLALLGVVLAPLWGLCAWGVGQLNSVLEWLASVPWAVVSVPAAPWWAQLAGWSGAVLLVLPLPWRLKVLALPLMLGLIWPPRELPAWGQFDVLALDVGQGTSVLVRTREHMLIFDTGPQYSPESNAGDRVLLPVLRARGEPRIDRLVLSHRDLDHVGGATALLKALPVADVLSSLEFAHPVLALAPQSTRCVQGQSWVWDGVVFEVLHPRQADYAESVKSNAMSCVVRVSEPAPRDASSSPRSLLLTGDIERAQEAALVAQYGQALRSTVLMAPHHGSRTSSTAAFLDAVQPEVAVFQAGYRNRFGHPAADVLARYRERGVRIVASPACGAWQWPAQGLAEGACQRGVARRYWHAASTEASSD
jgi:competence protein ComEC